MSVLISVIIPAYNAAKTIEKCLDSILKQTWRKFEIIAVDDGSIDNTWSVLKDYADRDARIKIFQKKNGGQSSARNLGLDHMKGDYFTFVDSDDYVYPRMLEELYRNMEECNSEISICSMEIWKNESKLSTYCVGETKIIDREDVLKAFLLERFSFGPMLKLYQSRKFGNMRFTEGIIFEDVEYLSRVFLSAESVSTIPYVGYCYLIHDTSTVHAKFTTKKLDLIKVVNIIEERVKLSCIACEKELNAFVHNGYLSMLLLAIEDDVLKQYETELMPLINWMRSNFNRITRNSFIPVRKKIYTTILVLNRRPTNKLLVKVRSLK